MAITFGRVAGCIFLLIALLHVYRLFAPFPIQIGSTSVPQEASWVGALLAGALGLWGLRSGGGAGR